MKTIKTSTPRMAKKPQKAAQPMRNDPILQELWAIKAELNQEAHYDAATLLRNAQRVVAGMRAT
jgi:hypothetical protein